MPAVDIKHISECAGLMKNADPALYETFLRLLDAYTHEVTVAVTEAPSTEILQAQGRAQQARKFFQMLAETRAPSRPTP